MATRKSILFVDAYDSFSQNIIALLHEELNVNVKAVHIDTDINKTYGVALQDFVGRHSAVVLGPGPGNPNDPDDVGMFYDLFDVATALRVPVLGICLGFQALCIKHGLRIERMKEPCHGQPKQILYRGDNLSFDDNHKDIFEGIDLENVWATCYNSLGLFQQNMSYTPNSSRPGSSGTNASFSTTKSDSSRSGGSHIRLLAVDREGIVMAVRHRSLPFWGFQFHPESCKSNNACRQLIRNWWDAARKLSFAAIAPIGNEPVSRALLDANTRLSPQFYNASNSLSSTSKGIAAALLRASSTSGQVVQWKKVKTSCSRSRISDLIHDMAANGNIAMLESTRKARFSIYAVLAEQLFSDNKSSKPSCLPSWGVQYQQSSVTLTTSDNNVNFCATAHRDDVWSALEHLMNHRQATGGSDEVPFWGGFIGYMSYEHGLDHLGIAPTASKSRAVPDLSLLWVERSLVYDNLTNSIYIQSIRCHDQYFIDGMAALVSVSSTSWTRSQQFASHRRSLLQTMLDTAEIKLPNHEEYDPHFHQCQSELRAGNSYELCLTTEATITVPSPPKGTHYEFELYKNLHAHNPVPFGAFLRLPGTTILGTSPEQYMSWSRTGTMDMIPMKGTVKRSPDMTFAKAAAILSTPKESAENLMIADLIRHDLYSTVGHRSKVEVVKLCEVVEHETVYQLVSHIRAHPPISADLSEAEKRTLAIHYGFKALRQTVPPGSMTGAPKKRSCEILSHLEQRHRGVYSGILGFMDVGGGGNWNVCIRTAFRCDSEGKAQQSQRPDEDIWHLGAGGAITVLSDAEGEWQEMNVKLDSVLQGFKVVKA